MNRRGAFVFPRFALLVVALLAMVSSLGCAARSEYMHELVPPQAIVAQPDAAVVVFIRPSAYAHGMKYALLDSRGRFLGDSVSSSHFAVRVPPGEHMFIAWGENTAALHAFLAPGRRYYVEVASRMGAFSSRVQLLAIKPRSESWQNLTTWLSETKQLLVDEPGGQAYLNDRREDVEERIRRAQEALVDYDAEELEARTLRPEDGT